MVYNRKLEQISYHIMRFGIRSNVYVLIMQILLNQKCIMITMENSCYYYDIITNTLCNLNH